MLYIMLGVIIFLLTFCAVGSAAREDEKGVVIMFGILVNIFIACILGGVYYFF